MNNLEDRLRDAYRSAAQTVRPEQVPAPRWAHEQAGRHERPVRRVAWRKLAPAAAAVAVVVVAVSSAVVLPRVLDGAGTAPAPGAAAGAPPKYMVVVPNAAPAGPNDPVPLAPLQVQDAVTGRVVATVRTPRAGSMWAAAAAVTSNTFVLAAEPESYGPCYTLLYTLRLTATGAPASLVPLAGPRISGFVSAADLAASASGMVAYAAQGCRGAASGPTKIAVFDTATARTRQWTISAGSFVTGGLALSADGKLLALGVPDTNYKPPAERSFAHPVSPIGSVLVLRTDSAPGPVTKRAHRVVTVSGASELTGPVLLSPDGSTVYVVTMYTQTAKQFASKVAAYDVATGALLRVVITGWHLMLQGLSADPGVDHAVASGTYFTEPVELDLATGQVHTPPVSLPRGFTAAAAW